MNDPIHPLKMIKGQRYRSRLYGGPFKTPLLIDRGEFVRCAEIPNNDDMIIKVSFLDNKGQIFWFPWIPDRETFYMEQG